MAQSAPSVATFRTRFPEFTQSEFSDALVSNLAAVAFHISGINTEATLYLLAHLVAVSKEDNAELDGGSGVVEEERLGPKSVKYVNQQMGEGDAFFNRTSYGRLFMVMESRSPAKRLRVVVAE